MAEVTRKLLNSYRGWLPRCLERKPLETLERGVVFGGCLFDPMQVRVLPSASFQEGGNYEVN